MMITLLCMDSGVAAILTCWICEFLIMRLIPSIIKIIPSRVEART